MPEDGSMYVGPSEDQARWRAFFTSDSWEPEAFQALLAREPPGAALFEVETYVNGLYRALRNPLVDPEAVQLKARWVSNQAERLRRGLSWRRRELDLGLLRWIRRASCLSVVAGAGVTMAAGGPSWAGLVEALLMLALERGHEVARMVPEPGNTPDHQAFRREVTEVRHLDAAAAERAREVLRAIEEGTASTEELMEGAQICYDLMGQHLFTDITRLLYADDRAPGPVHRAIAALAHPQHVPDRGGWLPGLHAIVTYNFDDLLGEALDAEGLARAAFAMRGDEVAGDPNERARAAGRDGLYQRIFHLHGYTPRRLFLITHVRFVFSTAQYAQVYAPGQRTIIDEAFEYSLANPVHHALYVGCSFQDEAMNGLLAQAAERLPGRFHYALLQWPGARPYPEATPEEINEHDAPYHRLGVRPLWFDAFDELPDLIASLT